jgi:hypothetical protein
MERRDRALKHALEFKNHVQGKADEKGVTAKAHTCLDHEVGAFINGSDDFFTAEDKAAERKRKEIEWDTNGASGLQKA